MSGSPSRLNRQTHLVVIAGAEEDVGSCGVPLHQAHFRAWPTSWPLSHQKAVRFLVSSCLGMSQILICQNMTQGGVSWHPCNPEQQNWQCPQKGQGKSLCIYLSFSGEAAGAPQRDRGFPKVFQPKQGLEMSPGFWESVPSLTCR